MTNSWTIQYDDGENVQTASATGKLSLDTTWAFVLDTTAMSPVIVLAVPQHRIINVTIND
jgi:hypothetical protein